jgi:predicted nucleic acid-binding protein
MIVYADASALIKRVASETGSELAADVWRSAARVVTSGVAYAEARAVLGAARGAGKLDDTSLGEAVCRLERIYADVELIDVDGEIADLAGGLAERHVLRGSAAIHLASALSVDAPRVVVTTWDRRLARASAESGLAVVPRPPALAAA